MDWEQLQPAPITKLAHETANALLRAADWNGKVERFVDEMNLIEADPHQAFQDAGVTDEMWEAARAALQVGLTPDKVSGWSKGYLTTHHPSEAFDEFKASREFEIHHRDDAICIGKLVEELLETLPRKPAPMEAVGQALIDAAQTLFGKDKLSALMKDGSVSPTIAKQVRFIDLGKEATPTQAHFNFVEVFIPRHYPARIAKVGDLYQLAAPTDTEQVEAFKRLMQCRIKHKHPDIDPAPENGDLTPPPASDPKAESKALVVSMRNNGHSYRKIAAEVGVSLGTAYSWSDECLIRSEDFLGKAYIEKSLNTPSVPESPETRTGTAFEADSADVGCLSNQTFRKQILGLLKTGDKKTSEIVDAILGKRTSVMDELKRLCDAGEIVKVKRGVYDLSAESEPPSLVDEDIKRHEPVQLNIDTIKNNYLVEYRRLFEVQQHFGVEGPIYPTPEISESLSEIRSFFDGLHAGTVGDISERHLTEWERYSTLTECQAFFDSGVLWIEDFTERTEAIQQKWETVQEAGVDMPHPLAPNPPP